MSVCVYIHSCYIQTLFGLAGIFETEFLAVIFVVLVIKYK